ncbi:hypothetical protein [Thermomonospora cellulosilytica]|uniref:Uncharacterized protein n=1 Tax=Thermomonospora cellulosilytica TaxID=1411118 RepID=A0A7W3R846_9ACTN|nr:hypothetical protein [Thermomonospora cellulosilytica]MBA9003913.1 hypothetical protein [Thermomonospora cellulosilytica]
MSITKPVRTLAFAAGTAGALAGALLAPATAAASAQAAAAPQTKTVRYGPFTIPAATSTEHGELPNQVRLNVEKPCTNCYITGFAPNLVYADGTRANINTGPMLHHVVFFNSAQRDVVCGGPRRIMSSGNERVKSAFPAGYGLKVGSGDRWTMLYDLMNHGHEEKTVYIEYTFTYERASLLSRTRPVTPIWMDAGGCADSSWDTPEGQPSERSRTWTSTISGNLVHMRAHLHHGGIDVRTANTTTGQELCRSAAVEGVDPEFIDHHGNTEVSDMPPCTGSPSLGRINRGDTLQITARYKATDHAHHGVMGIMTGYVHES